MSAGLPIADVFEMERPRLRAVATRILGSAVEADDAVQDAWFRLDRANSAEIENLGAWLTVVVSRISLDHVRARASRREDPFDIPTASALPGAGSAESDVILEESVYEALGLALNRLSPLEAVAFILHDLFQVPFDEIAGTIDRTLVATRKLASRARSKIAATAEPDTRDFGAHRDIVEAFMSAARTGDLTTLLSLLAPDARLTADATVMRMGAQPDLRGASAVAEFFEGRAHVARIVWFDGSPGAAWAPAQQIKVAFTFRFQEDGTIEEIALRSDPEWLDATDIEIEPRPLRKDAGG